MLGKPENHTPWVYESGQENSRIISLAESEIPGQENPSIILSES